MRWRERPPQWWPCAARRASSLLVVVVAASGCRSPEEFSPQLLELRVVVDTAQFQYGEPVGWRLELENLTRDSLGFTPGAVWGEAQFFLRGPAGALPRVLAVFDVVSSQLDWLQPREVRARLASPYPSFIVDDSERAGVFPLLPPGDYTISAVLRMFFTSRGDRVPVELSTASSFRVLESEAQRRDSIEAVARALVELVHEIDRGNSMPKAAIDYLDLLGAANGMPAWLGVPIYYTRAQVFSRPSSLALDSAMQSIVERFVRAHATRAYSGILIGALSPARRGQVCSTLLAVEANANLRTACQGE